uniref:Elongation factor Ts, mitochondrial n=1 Tax=Kalanchoe fedtschenkoi TaxID=63787 RepID=A0A7N0TU11_KALFE
MAFARCAKRPLGLYLCNRLTTSTSVASQYAQSSVASLKDFSQSNRATYPLLLRRFSAGEIGSSDQRDLIKKLRERTSAPIKDVKAALVATNWDIEEAQKELRRKGVVLASKKSSRTAAEGFLALAQNHTKAAIIELNCETDFVARNDIFQHLALSLARLALLSDSPSQTDAAVSPVQPELMEDLKVILDHPKIRGERTVQSAITEVAAMMGENVQLRRGFAMSAPKSGALSTYLHASPQPGLGRIAGLLSIEIDGSADSFDAVNRVGSELAMHIVAAKPLFLTKEHVSSDALDTEREILRTQAQSTGKPQIAIDKMVEGRLRKYFEEVVLMEQKFVVDDSLNVKTILMNLSKEVGSPVKIKDFFRMEVGEGIQSLEASNPSESVAEAA